MKSIPDTVWPNIGVDSSTLMTTFCIEASKSLMPTSATLPDAISPKALCRWSVLVRLDPWVGSISTRAKLTFETARPIELGSGAPLGLTEPSAFLAQ